MVASGRLLRISPPALGALRRDLIRTLGRDRARGLLLRFGWAWGQADASARGGAAADDRSHLEWLRDGPRLHRLTRMAGVETRVLEMDRERGLFHMEGCWTHSVEALEHLRHFGPADEPSCWILTGYATGYASTVMGRPIHFRELTCVAQGDEACHFVGRPAEAWGRHAAADAPFLDLTPISDEVDQTLERIRRENDQLQHVIAVHEQLTHVVARGAGPTAIAEALERLMGCAVSIEDAHLRSLARAGDIPTLGALTRRRPDLCRQLARLQRERRPLLLPAAAGEGSPDLVVAPILLEEDLLGFLTLEVVKGLRPALVTLVAERAALTCALELMRLRCTVEAAAQARGDFVDHLFAAGADAAFLNRWAHHLGLDLAGTPHRIILAEPAGPPTRSLSGSLAVLHWRFRDLLESAQARGLVVSRSDHVVGIVECTSPAVCHLPEELRRWAAAERRPVRVGVSRTFRGAAEAAEAHAECRAVLDALRDERPEGQVVRVDDLGALQLLFRAGRPEELRRHVEARLGPLLAYDRAHQTELLETLRLYLESACSLQATAERLNISVSGLKYRLQRISEVSGLDLDNPDVRFDVQMSLRLLGLLGGKREPAKSDSP